MGLNDAEARFMQAAAELLQVAIEEARMADAEAVTGLERLLRAGGLLTLRATLAPSTGLAQLAVDIAAPNGETCQLMAVTLDRMAVQ